MQNTLELPRLLIAMVSCHLPIYLLHITHFLLLFILILSLGLIKKLFLSLSGSKQWQKELVALDEMQKWELVTLPPKKHATDYRKINKIKTKADGFV